MEFTQFMQAVSEAFWHKDQARFKALIEPFLETARGEERGKALSVHASWILGVEPQNAAQGFVLIDDALPLVRQDPATLLNTLITALGLCYITCDVERARTYEDEACRLLLEQATVPEVRPYRHRLQLNLGQIAYQRGDFASAYWHFVQAINGLESPATPESERRGFLSLIQVHVAMACLRVRRFYEAQEALDIAEESALTEVQKLRTRIWRAELLRQLGQHREATELLGSIKETVDQCSNSEMRGRYFFVAALVAQDSGEVSRFHQYLSHARHEAAEHHHDMLLGEIQRFQRSPLQ